MAKLNVPPPFREPLKALAGLPPESADRLVEAITTAAPLREVAELERLVSEAVGDGDASIEWLAPALISLCVRLRDVPLEDVARGVAASPDLGIPLEEQKVLRERLRPLLTSAALATTANAIELLTQNDRNYRSARVLTDLRHVFTKDASERPIGAVIIEMLAVHTWNRDQREETLYIAMDETDLLELRDATQRALEKTSNLKGMLAEQNVTYFELDKREI